MNNSNSLTMCLKLNLYFIKFHQIGTSLVAHWLRLHAPNSAGPGLIPGQGTRSHMHATTKSLHATTKEPICCN